ncbi:MAG: VOC family protein [Elusimicrobia bacterium]|nr:VOC family protein [Elusimicrobiota bacterium]
MPEPIPEGYHSVTPMLMVKDARKALDFYKRAFAAIEVSVLTRNGGKIMHAEFKIGDSMIMLGEESSDCPQAKSAESLGGSPVSLNIYLPDADAAYRKAVAAGAKSVQPPEDSFWGDRYAMVKDPFGYSWGLSTHQKDLTPEQIKKGAQDWLSAAAGKR